MLIYISKFFLAHPLLKLKIEITNFYMINIEIQFTCQLHQISTFSLVKKGEDIIKYK